MRRSLQKPLLAALALTCAPSAARAQQPPIPPFGEPPAPSPQEQAAIEEQVKQAYLQQHKDELWKQAVSEVEQERKAAWEKRGRDQIPPSVLARTPGLEMAIGGSFAIGQFGKTKSYAAIVFESRLTYRIGLASGSSPIEGWALDTTAGPAVGF